MVSASHRSLCSELLHLSLELCCLLGAREMVRLAYCPSCSHLSCSAGLGWPLNYHLVFLLCAIVAIGSVLVSCLMPKTIEKKRETNNST